MRTFLLADVVDSTMHWERDTASMQRAIVDLDNAAAAVVADHQGVRPLEQGEGDNLVAVFDDAVEAVRCALDLQRLSPESGAGRLWLRIAVHTGDRHVHDGVTFAGPDLNRCSRLRGVAGPGQVVCSRTTFDLVRGHDLPGVSFVHLGPVQLRSIEAPERPHLVTHADLQQTWLDPSGHLVASTNVPAERTPLVGRLDDVETVVELCREHRIVTVTGSGGAGKTRVAMAAARRLVDDHPDGVWWVDLAPIGDPALIPAAVLDAVGESAAVATIATAAALVGELHATVVLDNAEHLVDGCAELVDALTASGNARILVTTREALGVAGEVAWRIPTLRVPDADAGLDDALAAPSVELFVAAARRARPSFAFGDENRASVVQICRRLDGVPLALELAAARVRMMSPDRIAAGLDDRFRVLTGSTRRAVGRQQTLHASVAWSHDLLDEDERIVFRRLAAFVGGFTFDAAEALFDRDDVVDPYAVLDIAGRLVDKSLVVADDDRLHMTETVRQFAAEQAVAAGESDLARDRHLAWVRSLVDAHREELLASRYRHLVASLDAEADNIRAAIEHGTATGRIADAAAIVSALPLYWISDGTPVGALSLAGATLERSDGLPDAAVAELQWSTAMLAMYANDWVTATQILNRVDEVHGQNVVGRVRGRLDFLRAALLGWSDLSAGLALTDSAITLAREADDSWCIVAAGHMKALLQSAAGTHTAMRDLLDDISTDVQELADPTQLSWHAILRGMLELATGSVDAARSFVVEALGRRPRRHEGDSTIAAAVMVSAQVAIVCGNLDESTAMLLSVRDRCRRAGSGLDEAFLGPALAIALTAQCDAAQALDLLDAQPPFGWSSSANFQLIRGQAELALGRRDDSRRTLEQAVELARQQIGDRIALDFGLGLGRLALAERDPAEARRRAIDAFEVVDPSLPAWMTVADAAHILGEAAALDGEIPDAARLLGASRGVIDRAGAVTTPMLAIAGAHSAVDVDLTGFEDQFAAGRAMTTAELIEWVLRGRGPRDRPSSGWESLTPTEVRVVDLVAAGATNKQIAERMFVSPGTVKTHLAHVYVKLGAANRVEVAAEHARRCTSS